MSTNTSDKKFSADQKTDKSNGPRNGLSNGPSNGPDVTRDETQSARMSDENGSSQTDAQKDSSSGKHTLSFSDIESVDQLRDELSLQAHLLRSELKERFEKIEKEWPMLNVQIDPIRKATAQAGADVGAAARLLFDTIRDSYKEIKRSAATH